MTAFALMGSGEFLPWAREVDRWAIDSSSVPSDRVLVVPTASAPEGEEVFARWAAMGTAHFTALGMKPEVLEVRTREDANDAGKVDAVAGARYIFFSGGNPAYLASVLIDSVLWTAIRGSLAAGASFGGCSAGVVAFGVLAPDPTKFQRGYKNITDGWRPGVPLFRSAYFGAHFDVLDRYYPGLRQYTLDMWPNDSVLFALDEETAAYGDGERWTVAGKGALTIPGQDGLERVVAGGEAIVDLGITLT